MKTVERVRRAQATAFAWGKGVTRPKRPYLSSEATGGWYVGNGWAGTKRNLDPRTEFALHAMLNHNPKLILELRVSRKARRAADTIAKKALKEFDESQVDRED